MAYASRSLSPSECNYSVTELEKFAVVWAITHFHAYLYKHSVTINMDHTALKTILETPNPSGKHARWWTKVYGLEIGEVKIVYHNWMRGHFSGKRLHKHWQKQKLRLICKVCWYVSGGKHLEICWELH